jgi:hypothetical protein
MSHTIRFVLENQIEPLPKNGASRCSSGREVVFALRVVCGFYRGLEICTVTIRDFAQDAGS